MNSVTRLDPTGRGKPYTSAGSASIRLALSFESAAEFSESTIATEACHSFLQGSEPVKAHQR